MECKYNFKPTVSFIISIAYNTGCPLQHIILPFYHHLTNTFSGGYIFMCIGNG